MINNHRVIELRGRPFVYESEASAKQTKSGFLSSTEKKHRSSVQSRPMVPLSRSRGSSVNNLHGCTIVPPPRAAIRFLLLQATRRHRRCTAADSARIVAASPSHKSARHASWFRGHVVQTSHWQSRSQTREQPMCASRTPRDSFIHRTPLMISKLDREKLVWTFLWLLSSSVIVWLSCGIDSLSSGCGTGMNWLFTSLKMGSHQKQFADLLLGVLLAAFRWTQGESQLSFRAAWWIWVPIARSRHRLLCRQRKFWSVLSRSSSSKTNLESSSL